MLIEFMKCQCDIFMVKHQHNIVNERIRRFCFVYSANKFQKTEREFIELKKYIPSSKIWESVMR